MTIWTELSTSTHLNSSILHSSTLLALSIEALVPTPVATALSVFAAVW
jgi:hypothetical protein